MHHEGDHGHEGDAGGDPEGDRERAELARRIRAAFAGAPYPGDDDLVSMKRDPAGLRESFAGRRSEDVTAELVNGQWDALLFMTPAAFRYYLPAYLIAVLRGEADDMAAQFLMSRLVPPGPGDGADDEQYAQYAQYAQLMESPLDKAERAAVVEFLAHVRKVVRQQEDSGEDEAGPYVYPLSLPDIDEALRLWRLHAENAPA